MLESFDLVTSYAAFEHFDQPPIMFENMKQLVKRGGYLYIDFSPLWRSADGHHMYRNVQFPYFHLIFSEKTIKEYYGKNRFVDYNSYNKWSALDFLTLFSSNRDMQIVSLETVYQTRDLYFISAFPKLLNQYSLEDLLISGFKVLFYKPLIMV